VWGCNPPQSKIGGPNLRGGGPDVVPELQNLEKMKDLLAENFENFWKMVVLRKNFAFLKNCF
jgi:hypothetical protein